MQNTTDNGRLVADISISLDGFVATEEDGIDRLVAWMFSGEVDTAAPGIGFRTSEASAGELRDAVSGVGALLSGRRNFELAGGWGGTHPMGVPVFVVTHRAPEGFDSDSIVFVTDGLESAVAQARAAAGGKTVGVATPSLTRQLLEAGLLDALHLNVVPVLLGSGVPFFAGLAGGPYELGDPTIVAGDGVTHMTYEVKR
jgi:dihydrofolate reductase